MNKLTWCYLTAFFCFFLSVAGGSAEGRKLPVVDGQEIVATVAGEPITLKEFNQELSSLHREIGNEESGGKIEYTNVLRRMIDARLIVQEARNIGLDKLPEIQKDLDLYAGQTLLDMALYDHVKDIEPDEETVNRLYKDAVREYRFKTAVFKKEDGANRLEKEVRGGKDFDELAAKLAEDGKADRVEEAEFVKPSDLQPGIADTATGMDAGDISPVLQLNEEFIVFKVQEIRYPDDPEAKEWAKKTSANQNKKKAVKVYEKSLRDKYAKVNDELLASLDFDAGMENFEKFKEDERVLAEVEGGTPVTVADLAKVFGQKYFHGVDKAMQNKELNEKKGGLLEGLLKRRLMKREAMSKGIDKSEPYQNTLRKYERGILFGTYIQKMIIPGMEVNKEDLQDYYDRHLEDYTSPPMVQIRAIAFQGEKEGEAAFEKLQAGSDFQWLSATSEGQAEEDAEGLLHFQENMLLTTTGLPEGVRKSVAGARTGDYRFYASPEGYSYIFYMKQVIPSAARPIEEVWGEIKKTVVNDKVGKEVEQLARRLEKYYPVKIYGTGLKK